MKKIFLISAIGMVGLLGACSGYKSKEAMEQIQYSKTHTGYADAAAMNYALNHQITPDSAVVLKNEHKW